MINWKKWCWFCGEVAESREEDPADLYTASPTTDDGDAAIEQMTRAYAIRKPRWFRIVFAASTAIYVISCILHLATHSTTDAARIIFKTLPVLVLTACVFAWAMWLRTITRGGCTRLRRARPFMLAAAFACYTLADLVVEVGNGRYTALAVVGVLCFGAGHVLLTVVFTVKAHGKHLLHRCKLLRIGPYVVIVVFFVVALFLELHPAAALGLLLYFAVLCGMVWRATARSVCRGVPDAARMVVAVGANLFLVGDALNLVDVFVYPFKPAMLGVCIIMVTYWVAVYMMFCETMRAAAVTIDDCLADSAILSSITPGLLLDRTSESEEDDGSNKDKDKDKEVSVPDMDVVFSIDGDDTDSQHTDDDDLW